MKVTGIELLNTLIDSFDIEAGTRFKLSKEDGETPFLDKNKILHTDGKSLYNELGEAPTIDLILNYDFEIIKEPKEELEEIEKLKKISYQIVGVYNNDINRIVKDFNKQIRQIGENINANVKITNDILANQNKIIRELKANKENE